MVNSWATRVNRKATSSEGKAYTSQLSQLINYYNKAPEADELDVLFSPKILK